MTGKSYLNQISEQNVSLAIQQLLIADYGTAWTAGRIDVDSPPTGFHRAGAVVEDTPQVTLRRAKFELKTGIPQVLQYQAITGMDGMLTAHLHSFNWRQMAIALGQITYTCSPTVVGSITSVVNANVYTLNATTALASLAVGKQITFCDNAAGADALDSDESVITSILADGVTIVIDVSLIGTVNVASLHNTGIAYYAFQRSAGGLSTIKKFHVLGVADFINGVQIVHQFQKCTTGDEIQEELRPAANPRVPISFNALGYKTSLYPAASAAELVVFERFYFPKGY